MRSITAALLLMLSVLASPPPSAMAEGNEGIPLWIDHVAVRAAIGVNDTHRYRVEGEGGGQHMIVARVRTGDLLLSLSSDVSGQEVGVLATDELVGNMVVPEGRHRLSVWASQATDYELIRMPIDGSADAAAQLASPARSEAYRWPEREVPELIRWAEGVIGSRWMLDSRSYDFRVAPGYRARLTARCQTGAYEAMIINASGRILPLLLPHHEASSILLEAGRYVVYLVANTQDAEYFISVDMRPLSTPATVRSPATSPSPHRPPRRSPDRRPGRKRP